MIQVLLLPRKNERDVVVSSSVYVVNEVGIMERKKNTPKTVNTT
jgi:hypothetical protein